MVSLSWFRTLQTREEPEERSASSKVQLWRDLISEFCRIWRQRRHNQLKLLRHPPPHTHKRLSSESHAGGADRPEDLEPRYTPSSLVCTATRRVTRAGLNVPPGNDGHELGRRRSPRLRPPSHPPHQLTCRPLGSTEPRQLTSHSTHTSRHSRSGSAQSGPAFPEGGSLSIPR